MKTSYLTLLSLVAVVVVSGCRQAPEAEVEAARTALMQADSVEADVYVSDLYAAAVDSFNAAQSELDVEDAKFGLGRDYGHVKELLAFTTQTAQDAASQVEASKEAMRVEADSLIALAQAGLAGLPLGTATTVTDSGLASVTTLVDDAALARIMGDYKSARDLAQAAVDKLVQRTSLEETTIPRS